MDETQLPHHVGGKLGNNKRTSDRHTKANMKEKATFAPNRKHLSSVLSKEEITSYIENKRTSCIPCSSKPNGLQQL